MEAPETPGDVGQPGAAPDPQDQLDYLAFLKFLPQDELEWQDRGAWPAAWRPQSTIGRLFDHVANAPASLANRDNLQPLYLPLGCLGP